MTQRNLRAAFIRGGTSKALVLHRADLPPDQHDWTDIFLAAIGSPDPNGRQLDGMGGGISSLSKVCVVGPPSRPDADVDYTFAQIGVTDGTVDYSANCGNMSAAIGPFALDEGLVPQPAPGQDASVRIHNTNTGKIIVARFGVTDGRAAVSGTLVLDGVAGSGAPVRLAFLDPGGARTGRLLPTGQPTQRLHGEGFGTVDVSLVDAANPCLFLDAEALDIDPCVLPQTLDHDGALLARLEAIRRAASVAMGLARTEDEAARIPGIPKVGLVAAPRDAPTLGARTLAAPEMDILVRMVSVGQPHRAVPLTGALCLAAACRIPGTIPHRLIGPAAPDAAIRIAHPSGIVLVDASLRTEADGSVGIESATVYRTTRRLFTGNVHYVTREPVEAARAA